MVFSLEVEVYKTGKTLQKKDDFNVSEIWDLSDVNFKKMSKCQTL